MADGPRQLTRAVVALVGATAVVSAELAGLALSTRLSVATADGALPGSVPPVPVLAVSVAAIGTVVAVHRHTSEGKRLTGSGAALIVIAPVTAFGGGCGFAGGGVTMFRSGVRLAVAVGECVTFFNGALLVLGYALLAAGLWLAAEELRLPNIAGLRSPKLSD
ncbi:hypothetical protein [Halolamina salifodinae]|uniref:Uncharacterized protein n=1 Tax=Halolamina salifodinae TaxID=1202767 RepID=A0A8T4GS42_9EURY|nr:hypothetical protein [Halolamina salifodinae]MBP1985656.1 hypothetical protein [Halolamina salifodinae]